MNLRPMDLESDALPIEPPRHMMHDPLTWWFVLQNESVDLSHIYLAYTAEGAEEALRPKSSSGKPKSGRPKTATRPKSSKAR